MTESADWSVTSWEGNRRLQHQEYLALPFRRKLEILEQMAQWTRLGREGPPEQPEGGEAEIRRE
jgi:hypothetical protein